MRTLPATLAFSVLLVAASPRVEAAASYDGCKGFIDSLPATLTTQGVWCLRKDLSTAVSSGTAISIDVNNVTIDCNGFKLGGLGGGSETQTLGIVAVNRLNPGVRDCNIRGFLVGIALDGADGAMVEGNRVEASTEHGIRVGGDGALILRNRVLDTGGRGIEFADSRAIFASGRIDILDNTVDGLLEDIVVGIYVSGNNGGEVARNRVRGLVGLEESVGIRSSVTARVVLRDNTVVGPGDIGVSCFDNLATSTGNVVSGFDTEVSGCDSAGDILNLN